MNQFIERYFGKAEWILVMLFLLTLPFVYTTKLLDPVLYSRFLSLTVLILSLTIVFVIRTLSKTVTYYFTKIDLIIFGSLLAYILANIISSFGVQNTKEAIFHLTKETTYALLFLYFYQLLRNNPKGKDILIKSVILMAVFYLAIGYVQLYKSDFTQFKAATSDYGYYFRQATNFVYSTLMNQVLFSSFLLLSLPFSIYGVIIYKKAWRIISGLVVFSSLIFILIMASKSIWGAAALAFLIAFFLGYFYLFFQMPKQTGKKLSVYLKSALLIGPAIIIIAGYVFIMKSDIKIAKMVVDKIEQVASPDEDSSEAYSSKTPSSTQTRVLAWKNTIKLFQEKPLFGIGGGQWWIEYPKYGLDGFEYKIRNGTMLFQRPHNDFLWILSENGIVGFFFYMVMFVTILFVAFRNWLKQRDWSNRLFAALAFSFLIGFMIDMFVSFPRERVTHNVMVIILFSLVLILEPVLEKDKKNMSSGLFKLILSLFIIVLTILNVSAANQFFDGEKSARVIKNALKSKNYNLVLRESRSTQETLYTLDNFTTPMKYYEGVALSSLNNLEDAKKAFTEAYKINPFHLHVINNLATCYDLTGDKQTALTYYQKALDISPRYKEALVNMAIVYYNLKDFDKAMNCILRVPANEENPEKYELAMINISKRKAILVANKLDNEKLKKWIADTNKIKATFVKAQNTNSNFDGILLEELSK